VENDFVALPGPRRGDRSQLEAVLSADTGRQRARDLRVRVAHLLVGLGVPLWLAVAWPNAVSAQARAVAGGLWGCAFLALLLALGWEWRSSRLRSWRIAQLGTLRPLTRPPGDACAGGRPEES
jgi:hypothetical protein